MIKSNIYIAIPPGETIKEQLHDKGMSLEEFALRMDMPKEKIRKLINGEATLTPDLAMRLELVFGIPKHFWNSMEAIYREKISLIQEEKRKRVKQLKFYTRATN